MSRACIITFVSVALALAASLALMGRPAICTCGHIDLWGPVGPTQSQMLADWYSPSHLVHGFLFYWFAWAWLGPHKKVTRFTISAVIEALWEIAENTPYLIDRYREATIALGYSGDSIVNSVSDLTMMAIGYFVATRIPAWASVVAILALELTALAAVRDNLTLNVLMLLFPNETIANWQAGS